MANYYICDACKFQFTRQVQLERCPDCGKEAVREADEKEIEKFKKLLEDDGLWDD